MMEWPLYRIRTMLIPLIQRTGAVAVVEKLSAFKVNITNLVKFC